MTTPAKPTKRARPARKSAKGTGARRASPGRRYTEEERTEALLLVEEKGTAHAHKVTGIPKQTLSRWTAAAGIDTAGAARARTVAATEASRARAAEVSLSTVELLEQHVAQAGDYLATIAGVNALAARTIAALDPDLIEYVSTMGGPVPVVKDRTAQDLKKIADALGSLPLAVRDAEGLITRAVHDLQLLKGEATERGELVVEFNVPRPAAAPAAEVLEIDTTD